MTTILQGGCTSEFVRMGSIDISSASRSMNTKASTGTYAH